MATFVTEAGIAAATGATSETVSISPSGTNLVLYVVVTHYGSSSDPTGVTFNGVAMTKLASGIFFDASGRTSLWRLIAPDTGAHDIVVSWGASVSEHSVAAVVYSGVDQTTPERATPLTDFSGGPTPTLNVTTVAGDTVLGASGYDGVGTYSTSTSTIRSNHVHVGNDGSAICDEVASGTTTAVTQSDATSGSFIGCLAWALLDAAASPTGQTAAPTADSVDGAWLNESGSATNLFASVDESTASDTDYIESESAPASSAVRLKLDPTLADPLDSTGHILHWRAGKDATGGAQIDVTIDLYQGGGDVAGAGTLIATRSHTNVDALTTYDETLTGTEADAITDYGDLYVEITANQV